MPLLITIARKIPDSTFQTVWTGDTCSTAVSHTLPDSLPSWKLPDWAMVRLPVFNAAGAAIPGRFEYIRKAESWACADCGDSCADCPFVR
jgi:hypothetical protein